MPRMNPRQTRPAHALLRALAALALASPLACGGQSGNADPSASAGREIDCGGKKRAAASCESATDPGRLRVTANETKQEERAASRINEQLDKLVAERARLCSEYNACSLDEATYAQRSAAIEERIRSLPPKIEAMANAKSYGERKRALDDIYRGYVPEEQRVEELTFRMGMRAELPQSAGGGAVDVQPGASVPTNARVAFSVEVSRDAHLYIFQKTPGGEVTVLFPEPRIGTQNPLRAGTSVELPPNGQRFRVNEKDVGTENVYIVASRTPIQSLDAALQKVKDGSVTQITQDKVLKAFTSVVPGAPPANANCKTRALELDTGSGEGPSCTRTRGLVLDEPSGGAAPSAGSTISAPAPMTGRTVMEVRTDPGDDMIVKVFPFKHLSEQDYAKEAQAAKASGGAPKTRGIIIDY